MTTDYARWLRFGGWVIAVLVALLLFDFITDSQFLGVLQWLLPLLRPGAPLPT